MGEENLESVPDEVLAQRFQTTGGPQYFSEIFRRYKKSVFAGCLAMLRSRMVAEELTQETFIRLFTRIDTFRGGSFKAWIHRVARNLCLNQLADHGRGEAISYEDARAPGEPVKGLEPEFLIRNEVRTILNQLTAQQRITMKLFYLDGYRYGEIGERLGLSPEQVKSSLQNGKRQFRIRWQRVQSAKGPSNEP